jgi:sporulation protein YlmC with PRC-barrel domain
MFRWHAGCSPRSYKGGKIMHIRFVKTLAAVGLAAVIFGGATSVSAQVAGTQTLAVSQEEMKLAALGWSAKKNMLGKAVYNDSNQKIGTVDDIIISPDQKVSFAIIGVGGFLGIGKHDVAIPMNHLKIDGDRYVLPGATKEALKALPAFEYAKAQRVAKAEKSSTTKEKSTK